MKITVIGLDGAAFELIDPWMLQGELPNLRRFKEEGVWGDMDCGLPPTTSPNWKCYSTGKNPGKLGIAWWENISFKRRAVYFPRARIYNNKEIWDYLGDDGKRVGVVGMPLTYPPKPVNGFMVSGGGDADLTSFTYPEELEGHLRSTYDYQIHPSTIVSLLQYYHDGDLEKIEPVVAAILRVIDCPFRFATDLVKKEDLDFLHVTTFYINNLQHYLWNSEYVLRGWKIIDRHVGELMEGGRNVIIMSDHGCNEIKQVFNINTWLANKGYLQVRKDVFSALQKVGVTQGRVLKIAQATGLTGVLSRVIPKKLRRLIPREDGSFGGGLDGDVKTRKMDWDRTLVLASGQGPIYINRDMAGKEYETLRDEIGTALENLRNPATGEGVVNKVYRREEIYSGGYLEEMPDLIMDQAKGVHIPDDIGKKDVFSLPSKWRGENKRTGLFLARGPDISRGEVKGVSIQDLAPTILHLMGMPVPSDMDGKVVSQVFEANSEPAQRRVAIKEVDRTDEEKQRIKNTLKRLKA